MESTMLDKTSSADQPELSAAEFRASVAANFKAGSERMGRIETTQAHIAKTVDTMATQNTEMYEIFSAMKGGFKVLEWLGRLAKWGAGLAAAVATVAKIMGWSWPFK